MSKITVSVNLTKKPVTVGVVVAALVFTLTDSTNAQHVKTVAYSDWADFGATANATAVYADGEVPDGDFAGTIQAVTADGDAVGDALSFASPENDQFLPASVTVTLG